MGFLSHLKWASTQAESNFYPMHSTHNSRPPYYGDIFLATLAQIAKASSMIGKFTPCSSSWKAVAAAFKGSDVKTHGELVRDLCLKKKCVYADWAQWMRVGFGA